MPVYVTLSPEMAVPAHSPIHILTIATPQAAAVPMEEERALPPDEELRDTWVAVRLQEEERALPPDKEPPDTQVANRLQEEDMEEEEGAIVIPPPHPETMAQD